jgi:hypothetical protein
MTSGLMRLSCWSLQGLHLLGCILASVPDGNAFYIKGKVVKGFGRGSKVRQLECSLMISPPSASQQYHPAIKCTCTTRQEYDIWVHAGSRVASVAPQ